jgi:hypothetical protein
VGDYSNINTGAGAGYAAIHLKRALATSGFNLQTTKNGKGQQSIELTGHYTITDQSDMPYEIYIKAGEAATTGGGATGGGDTGSGN